LAYTQLTREQRYQIYILRKAGHSQNFIAEAIGVHPSTITRELVRGRGQRRYRPKQADESAQTRKQKRYQPRIKAVVWQLVEGLLRQDRSPEQVAGWLSKEKQQRLSHERIYQYIPNV
jgi:transposase, IS30 family